MGGSALSLLRLTGKGGLGEQLQGSQGSESLGQPVLETSHISGEPDLNPMECGFDAECQGGGVVGIPPIYHP